MKYIFKKKIINILTVSGRLRVPSSWHSHSENIHNKLQGRAETRTDTNIPIHVSII